MSRKLKNTENEKCTLQDLEFAEKFEKREKCDTYCSTRNVDRKTEFQDLDYGIKLINVENETQTLYDMEYSEKN